MNNLLRHKINIILALFCTAMSLTNLLHSQTTYIFKDDSLKKAKFMGKFENSLNQPYVSIPFYDLKEKLPDGEYIVVNINRKDSVKKVLNNYIEIRGHYKDSLRHGKFEYYNRFKIKERWINKLMSFYTYKNGFLDGYYFSNNTSYKYAEGYYKEGKRHGFFITYDYYGGGEVQDIELYIEDTLKYRVNYKVGEMQPLEIDPSININDYKIGKDKNIPNRFKPPVKK